MQILVTGASGYIGGPLIERLLGEGHTVRVMVRSAERVAARSWSDGVDVVEADLVEDFGYATDNAGWVKSDRRVVAAVENARVVRLQMPPDQHRSTVCDHISSGVEDGCGKRAAVGQTRRSSRPWRPPWW